MSGQNVGYILAWTSSKAAISPSDQIKNLHLDLIFQDDISGESSDRPELDKLRDHVKAGDMVVVQSMDRLSQSIRDLNDLVTELTGRGVAVQFLKEDLLLTSRANGAAMLNLLAAVAEFERVIGIKRLEGTFRGGRFKLDAEQVTQLRIRIKAGESKRAVAEAFRISTPTLDGYLKRALVLPIGS